jgi:hypothetical protein
MRQSYEPKRGTAPTSNGSLRVAVGLPVAPQTSATTQASFLYSSKSLESRHTLVAFDFIGSIRYVVLTNCMSIRR